MYSETFDWHLKMEWNMKTCNNMIQLEIVPNKWMCVCVCVSYICDGGSRALLKLFCTKFRINAGLCGVAPHTIVLRVGVLTQTTVLTAHWTVVQHHWDTEVKREINEVMLCVCYLNIWIGKCEEGKSQGWHLFSVHLKSLHARIRNGFSAQSFLHR